MDYLIREGTKSDIPKLLDLEKLCFQEPWSEEDFTFEMNNDLVTYHLCFDEDELIAYVGFLTVLDECQINNVAVHPNYRRSGLGSKMIERVLLLTEEMGLKFWLLEVNSKNEAAIKLYESFDFEEVGLRANYYGRGQDAILMTREIDE